MMKESVTESDIRILYLYFLYCPWSLCIFLRVCDVHVCVRVLLLLRLNIIVNGGRKLDDT